MEQAAGRLLYIYMFCEGEGEAGEVYGRSPIFVFGRSVYYYFNKNMGFRLMPPLGLIGWSLKVPPPHHFEEEMLRCGETEGCVCFNCF